MNTPQLDEQHLQQISRFPVEQHQPLTALANAFPEALDLAFTNPPLAVALANARGWDTFGLATVDRQFIGGLLRQRRRRICGALGYPSSERVVGILGKVQPQACSVNLLARVRCSFRNPALLSIFSHLPAIGAAELRVAADLGDCPNVSIALFADLAAQFTRETVKGWGRILRQTEALLQPRRQECRLFEWAAASQDDAFLRLRQPHGRLLRSVLQVRRCYHRLWRDLAKMAVRPVHEHAAIADIPFPEAPLPGIDDIQPINSAAALVEEARAMEHCVLDYAGGVAEGDTYLYRVMNPERATLLIDCRGTVWRMKELAGVRNEPVSSETEDLVESWLRHAQQPIRND